MDSEHKSRISTIYTSKRVIFIIIFLFIYHNYYDYMEMLGKQVGQNYDMLFHKTQKNCYLETNAAELINQTTVINQINN